ncbi:MULTISPECIES: MogA/MoaB family molybdenum cofactor biosynthesis protein [unclassified Luteococcus]|uniref:MogA/MoaB family molybdenum cofactor biosynthesis protein n=1 Tax=unclassified Luteococcus TaxID=2639923 RepID=UPI00313DD40C
MTQPENLGRAVVITASDRAAAGQYTDRSGPLAAQGLAAMGFSVDPVVLVPDGEPVGQAIAQAVAAGAAVVLTTGGTGLAPRDLTPEVTRPLLTRELPQLAALIAQRGVEAGVPTAVLSRGLAGLAGTTVVVNLPGSAGGVRDGLTVLEQVLPHAVAQARGRDH